MDKRFRKHESVRVEIKIKKFSMNQDLKDIVKNLMMPGKGLLAADESNASVEKRFAPIGLENTEDNRRAFRELFLTAPGIGKYISGIILYDETLRQSASTGESFVSILQKQGIIAGIKVDLGLEPDPSSPNEKLTKGLDTLPARLATYVALGARFAKWRALITITEQLPTQTNIDANTATLAQYAKMCQVAGVVPIVEPEVFMEGDHSLEQCELVTTRVHQSLFLALHNAGVNLEGLILKSNMVIEGKDYSLPQPSSLVAAATIRSFKKTIPTTIGGIVFLSGGQSEKRATENLNAIHQMQELPWVITFSYARALQDSATKYWEGKPTNMAKAQTIFLHRAKMNSLAQRGQYSSNLEMDGVDDFGAAQASQD